MRIKVCSKCGREFAGADYAHIVLRPGEPIPPGLGLGNVCNRCVSLGFHGYRKP